MNQLTKLAAWVTSSIAAVGFTSTSIAASTSATFNVSVSVIQSCTVASESLSSRNYKDGSGARFDALVKTSPACPLVTAHAITISAGNGVGTPESNRQPAGPGGPVLMDRVFSDAAGVSVLRDDNGGAVHKFSLDLESTKSIPLQGRVPVEQNALVGMYADTLTLMLIY